MGKRLKAHSDQPVRKATMVPIPAPDRIRPAATGRLTNGPPGASPPASDPTQMPRQPEDSPTQRAMVSWGSRTCTMPAVMNEGAGYAAEDVGDFMGDVFGGSWVPHVDFPYVDIIPHSDC